MKPAAFDYVAPRSLDEVLLVLSQADGGARLLAGGQSLMPLLNLRLARPARLIDLNRVPELAYVAEQADGVAIGAMTRQATLERHPALIRHQPLLAEALKDVGHPATRARATLGGSLAHADPAAELPAVAVCLGARLRLVSPRGERTVDAEQFCVGYLSTVLEPDEILTDIWLPAPWPRSGYAWLELARRQGDLALAGVAVALAVERQCVTEARIVVTGVGGTPFRAREAEIVLVGGSVAERASVAARAVRGAIDPPADSQCSRDYRVHLAGVLTERAIRLAGKRAAHAQQRTPVHD